MAGLLWGILAVCAQTPDPLLARIRVLHEESRIEEAARSLADYLGDGKSASRIASAMLLATEWERTQEWERSIWMFRSMREILPQWPGATLNLANVLRRGGHYEESLAVFHDGIGRFPADGAFPNDLGLLYQSQNKGELAETAFREAIRLGHEDTPANLAILGRLGKSAASGRDALESLLREKPQSAWARRCYALWRLERNPSGRLSR